MPVADVRRLRDLLIYHCYRRGERVAAIATALRLSQVAVNGVVRRMLAERGHEPLPAPTYSPDPETRRRVAKLGGLATARHNVTE